MTSAREHGLVERARGALRGLENTVRPTDTPEVAAILSDDDFVDQVRGAAGEADVGVGGALADAAGSLREMSARHSEWVCFEHTGFPREKAVSWWRRRVPQLPAPSSVDEALQHTDALRQPIAIQVRPTGQYTEITAARFM